MISVKISKYLKLIDIQRILMYVFNRARRPSFIQFRAKPKSIILVFLKEFKQETQNSSFLNENKTEIENIEPIATQKEMKYLEKLYNYGIRTYCSINESLGLDLIYKNLLNDITVKDNNLNFITKEAIDMIEKHDIYQIFSYTQFIKDQTAFDTKVFKNYVRPNKKTKYFLIGIDCEMLITKAGKRAGRVSMVDNTGKLIYDKYVIPPEPVIDFLEKYSGLNQDNTKNGIEFRQMQEEILEFIGTNTYICGHGLENDLEVLELYIERIIDTAYLFLNSQGYKLKLKQLSWCYLKEIIQTGKHNPVEDALSCLKLLNYKIQQLIKIYDPKGNKIKLNSNIKYIDDLNEIENGIYLNSLYFYKANIEELSSIKRTTEIFPIFFYEEEGKNFLAYY